MGRARQGQSTVTADRFAGVLGTRRGGGRGDERNKLRSAAMFMDSRSNVCLAKIRGEAGAETIELSDQATGKLWVAFKAGAVLRPGFGRDGIGLSSPSPAVFMDAATVAEVVAWTRAELAWTAVHAA